MGEKRSAVNPIGILLHCHYVVNKNLEYFDDVSFRELILESECLILYILINMPY